jgi:hypothetical protein
MNLQVVFQYLINALRESEYVREVRVLDQGALLVNQAPHGFDEDIAVYLLGGELSVEFIKTAVNGNNRADIHTMFIISSDLLPANGAAAQSDEGLRLLLDLFNGKVFAYHVDAREVTIFPVFVSDTVTYGQPVNVADLSSDYAELRTSKHIRGVRKVASFVGQRFHASSKPKSPRVYDPMKPFYDLLDVPVTANEDEIKKAYRQKARQHHPDADPSPDATTKMQAINEAYDKIIKRFHLVK